METTLVERSIADHSVQRTQYPQRVRTCRTIVVREIPTYANDDEPDGLLAVEVRKRLSGR